MQSLNLDLDMLLRDGLSIAAAFVLTLPIAWERGYGPRSSGFRTLPIVAMAACGIALILRPVTDGSPDASARVLQGVITGIGFIGGGAILKNGTTVHGLATAASIWNAGAIGLAAGMGRFNIAIVLSLINFLSLIVLARIDKGSKSGGGDQ
ncbi:MULTISPECIES: MgtC/SapB family protein [Hyphobacterium]|uniref:Protein MgtC n=1 Tax=Hyphobacterium vulgare TaxID=1736751 RepID=A0ABV7A1C1_9PROT